MFGIGGFELFLILVFGFLIFGPDKLPQIANTVGKAIAKFRSAQEDMKGQLNMDAFMDKNAEDPFKNPLDVIENAAGKAKAGAAGAQAKADAVTEAAVQKADAASSAVTEHTESFAERKARYDRERRARKEAEAAAQAEAQAAAQEKASADPRTEVPKKEAASASDAPAAADAKEVS